MTRDDVVYQQATRISVFGLAIQIILGIALLVFARVVGDSVLVLASVYVLSGIFIWTSLIVLFYQHSLERIEAIENDEIDQQRGGTESVFAGEREPSQAAARRLKFMNQWFMPIVSLLMVIVLATIAYFTLAWLRRLDDTSGNAVTF
ncbi:hypothetical protein LBMAG51_03820 [Phycisphaerae bacterium]|nr:hypothetical protein LBMAG51_03820 [Phycisphaerae bacterium]